jgi:uncharacterized membrane protein SirB2
MWRIDVSRSLGAEYVPLVQDVLRMVSIQATLQLMGYLGEETPSFLTPQFGLLVIYVVLGVMMYWLAVKRLLEVV